ncbi:MAG: MAPEG family protein [Acidiferrobacterales bacterium]
MPLTEKQIGVLKGIIPGAFIALCIVGLGSYLNPFTYQESLNTIEKLKVAILSCIIPAVFLAASIGRLAKHRFFTPEDIDGGGLSNGSAQATLLQSLLQNTFEQTLLASLVYCAWSVVMSAALLSVVPTAAIAFGLGRILFFIGYKKGAPSRAIGFTLSFYPSIIMLVVIIGTLIWRQIS